MRRLDRPVNAGLGYIYVAQTNLAPVLLLRNEPVTHLATVLRLACAAPGIRLALAFCQA